MDRGREFNSNPCNTIEPAPCANWKHSKHIAVSTEGTQDDSQGQRPWKKYHLITIAL